MAGNKFGAKEDLYSKPKHTTIPFGVPRQGVTRVVSGFKSGPALRVKENVPISDQQFRATRGLRVTYDGHVFN